MSVQNPVRAQMNDLFQALLRLHKALLDSERLSYERIHGRVESNGQFLQLVLTDAWFAWLRPLSQSITKLEEFSEEDPIPSNDARAALRDSIQRLLTPSEEGEGFGRHYYNALQQVPDVGLAHAEVKALLRSLDTHGGRIQDEH